MGHFFPASIMSSTLDVAPGCGNLEGKQGSKPTLTSLGNFRHNSAAVEEGDDLPAHSLSSGPNAQQHASSPQTPDCWVLPMYPVMPWITQGGEPLPAKIVSDVYP